MIHTYSISGMTCAACAAKVKSALLSMPDVQEAEVDRETGLAVITMNRHIATADLQKAIAEKGNYKIESGHDKRPADQTRGWFETYKPILLIFTYMTLITLLIQWGQHSFHPMQWMRHFMAGFFLVFSFFKMLSLSEFADSYAGYDILAKRFPAWGFVYAFTELALGIAYLINFNPLLTNAITFVIMSLSIIGVLQSVLHKKQIQCACLGAVFNLPMSTVTIIEDALMIVMSGAMFISLL